MTKLWMENEIAEKEEEKSEKTKKKFRTTVHNFRCSKTTKSKQYARAQTLSWIFDNLDM